MKKQYVSDDLQQKILKHLGIKKLSNVDFDLIGKIQLMVVFICVVFAIGAILYSRLTSSAVILTTVAVVLQVPQFFAGPQRRYLRYLQKIRRLFGFKQDDSISVAEIELRLMPLAAFQIVSERYFDQQCLDPSSPRTRRTKAGEQFERAEKEFNAAFELYNELNLGMSRKDIFKLAEGAVPSLP